MRIISGTHKGRRFHVRGKFKSRPTTDFAKETLFNVLCNYYDFEGIDVLDLFSGTGSISFEFASRGAKVIAIEKDFRHCSAIRNNMYKLGLEQNIKLKNTNALKYISKSNNNFDIIFADPPFDLKCIGEIPFLVLSNNILKEDGLFVIEHSERYSFNDNANFERIIKTGSVCFSIFSHQIIRTI